MGDLALVFRQTYYGLKSTRRNPRAIVLLALGAAAYDVAIHGEAVVGLVVYAALGTATMCALGVAVSAFAPNAEAAGAIGPFSAVILSFISSVFVPIDQLPEWLQQVGRVFPLSLWAVGSAIVAARAFKWEPQSARG